MYIDLGICGLRFRDNVDNLKLTKQLRDSVLRSSQGFAPRRTKSWFISTIYAAGSEINLTADTTLTARYRGCYVETAVYGSYDCPEVWTLRRFRDKVLANTWYGRLFIRFCYAVSPTAVKLFGETEWFQKFWRGKLDRMVSNLQSEGFASTPHQDVNW